MFDTYRKIIPSPAAQAGVVGLGAGGLTYAAWKPIISTLHSLGRPLAAANGEMEQWYEECEGYKNSAKARLLTSALMGLTSAGLSAALTYRGNERYGGFFQWNAPTDRRRSTFGDSYSGSIEMPGAFAKRGSLQDPVQLLHGLHKSAGLDFMEDDKGLFDVDYSKTVRASDMGMMFSNDPTLANDQYVRNFGTSIINAAAIGSGTPTPTLGAVKDAAQDKFETKFGMGSMLGTAAKAVLANQASRLFVDAVGTVANLSDNAKENLVSAGTWGSVISSIINIGD